MRLWKAVFVIGLTAFCLVFAAGARADYPMEVKWAFEVPANINELDVQYWMSDSAIGYAYTRAYDDDTVHWTTNLSDLVNHSAFPPPDTDFVRWESWESRNLRILKLDSDSALPMIATQFIETWIEGTAMYRMYVVDLQNSRTVFRDWTFDIECNSTGNTFNECLIWPPLPAVSHVVAFTVELLVCGHVAGCDFYYRYGEGCLFDLNSDSIVPQWFRGYSISPFRLFDANPTFTLWYNYSSGGIGDRCDNDECYGYFSRVALGQPQQNGDTLPGICSQYDVIAQTDGDGTQRVIPSWTLMALNPLTWDTLWQRPPIPNNGVYSARLPDSPDERILLWNAAGHRFTVLSAADGSVLGQTAPLLGNLHHIIKRRNYPDEVVTVYDPPGPGNWQVLVYAFGVPSVEKLTICYVPAVDAVRLRWQPRMDAAGYHVSASNALNGEYQEIATVASTQSYYDVPITEADSLRFFHVTASFDSVR